MTKIVNVENKNLDIFRTTEGIIRMTVKSGYR